MKKNRKSRIHHLALYKYLEENVQFEDTRYYGVFKTGKGIKVDPKRYFKTTHDQNEIMKKTMDTRFEHLFKPKKSNYYDYNVNQIVEEFKGIKQIWNNDFKPIIRDSVSTIKKISYTVADDHNFMAGISGINAARARADYYNRLAKQQAKAKEFGLTNSMFAQFFHLMMSMIEAITVAMMHKNGFIRNRFYRNDLYKQLENKNIDKKNIEKFKSYDKAYSIWHFIKHNSQSTYDKLKNNYANVLMDVEFEQGDLAIRYIKFSNKLIETLLEDIRLFFIDYCKKVFSEDLSITYWNYEDYFLSQANAMIEDLTNPLGLDFFDDLD